VTGRRGALLSKRLIPVPDDVMPDFCLACHRHFARHEPVKTLIVAGLKRFLHPRCHLPGATYEESPS
jgi:hypothetical protein